jgi:hypothetical protein
MTIYPSTTGQATNSTISTIQSLYVHFVQSTSLKGTQQPRGKNNKGKDKKGVVNNNKNEKYHVNVGRAKKEKKKVKLPCNLCSEDHLTNLCPKMEETQCLLVQQ